MSLPNVRLANSSVFCKASVQFQSRSEFYCFCCLSECKAVRSSICFEGQTPRCLLGRLIVPTGSHSVRAFKFKVQRSEVKFTGGLYCLYCLSFDRLQ